MGNTMIWGALLHFGYNMWSDIPDERENKMLPDYAKNFPCCAKRMRLDVPLWNDVTARMAAAKMNAVVIDVGEGLAYPSHPELAVEGSWAPERLSAEVKRLASLGLEAIPKLNFSTSHDSWLGEYGRMVATPEYYRVCADVIRDVWEVFGHPRLFHLGYDEESAALQIPYDLAIIRQGELWWHDFGFFERTLTGLGMRPWIWSDYCWHHREEFLNRMPKTVLQSNWYYHECFDVASLPAGQRSSEVRIRTYETLEKAGFDQVPCMSNCREAGNIRATVANCSRIIAPERLKGFLVAPWARTQEAKRDRILEAIDLTAAARNGI